jgi:hypothetical protein
LLVALGALRAAQEERLVLALKFSFGAGAPTL